MTLEQRLTALAQAIGADVKTLTAAQGSLAALTTAQKSSLVAAINELKATLDAQPSGSVAEIDDAAAGNSTAKTYSAAKITQLLGSLKTEILGGASAAFDTLLELQTALESENTATQNLLTAVANRVRFDAAQTLTGAQQGVACANIGVGNPDRDFAADYAAAKL